ncbi:MAG: hypothetical protein M3022_09710 [Actinomycetota bacterium]|nr:hypothetical protein [Actinomycetota bacterium]
MALRVGGVVPADLRIIEADQLECDEAVLTGESMAAAKTLQAVAAADSAVDLPSCAFMGTAVRQGAGRGGGALTPPQQALPSGPSPWVWANVRRTPRSRLTCATSGFLVKVAGVLTISIFVINVALSRPLLDAFLFSLAIAIGITPQLLPAIVSVSLSPGSRALARKRVLVKRLVTIEALGNIEFSSRTRRGR